MDRQRVLILCTQSLLGEGIQLILGDEPAVEVVDMASLAPESLDSVGTLRPDVIILAEESHSSRATWLTGQLLQAHPETPLIRVALEEDRVQIYSGRQVPASAADLKDALRCLIQPAEPHDQPSTEVE
ncbi:MAG: hypothetical protein ACE5LU_11575 [Anaerolineae bacterium]